MSTDTLCAQPRATTAQLHAVLDHLRRHPRRWEHLVDGDPFTHPGERRRHRLDEVLDAPDQRHGELAELDGEPAGLHGEVEVWVRRWRGGDHSPLHDHGRSSAAVTLVEGALLDDRVSDDGEVRTRRLDVGHRAVVERGDVHRLVNPGLGEAVSLHVASPPLTTLGLFTASGGLLQVDSHTVLANGR